MSNECWITTVTGKQFDLLDPQPDQICIEDIAHALAVQNRWTGHTRVPFSVAEHSYHVSLICQPCDALWGLLHDASEAYMSDLSRPLKHASEIGPPYLLIERKIMDAICDKFGMNWEMPASVKEADTTLLWAEKAQLMPRVEWKNPQAWNVETRNERNEAKIALDAWPWFTAKKMFLKRFAELKG